MIESIIKPGAAEHAPWETFIAGFVFTVAACILVLQIGTSSPCNTGLGLLTVAFITIAAAPFFVTVFRIEERIREGNLIERHRMVIAIFIFFFLSIIVASALFYMLIPQQTAQYVFSDQLHDLNNRGIISGSAVNDIGFLPILLNNLRVLGLSFVFSLIFGAGAIYIIAWNATILGVLIAKIAETPAAYGSITVVQGNGFANLMAALPFTLLRILPHGIFEFGGYFLGAIAGGILSVAIIQETLLKDKQHVFYDSLVYLGLGALCILVGSVVEVVI